MPPSIRKSNGIAEILKKVADMHKMKRMLGWKNIIVAWGIWILFILYSPILMPPWMAAVLAFYLLIGEVVCNVMRIRPSIDNARFDVVGVMRSFYWVMWWPLYLARRPRR